MDLGTFYVSESEFFKSKSNRTEDFNSEIHGTEYS